jgi:hypothetical protein
MKFLKGLTLLFFYTLSLSAQTEQDMRLSTQSIIAPREGSNITGSFIPPKPQNNYIKGSQYLFNSWVGQYTIMSKTGVKSQLLNLNYNITSKKIESFIGKDSVFQYDLDQFDYIVKANKKYKVYNNNQLEGLFLELFNNNKLVLYKEVIVKVEEGALNPLTQELISENEYVKKEVYYIAADDKCEKIKLNKKDLNKYLSDKEDLIKVYVKENKLTYTSEADVLKILNYYNLI